MANPFPFEYSPVKSYYEKSVEIHKEGALQLHEPDEDWGDFDFFCSEEKNAINPQNIFCFSEENMIDLQNGAVLSSDGDLQQQSPQNSFLDLDFGIPDDVFQLNITPPSFPPARENSASFDSLSTEFSDLIQPMSADKQCNPTTLASLDLLNGYKGCRYNKMNGRKLNEPCSAVDDCKRLSTEEVMRIAGAQYIRCSVSKDDRDLTMIMRPYGCAFSGLSEEEIKEIELAQLLLASAEKIGNHQFDRGSKLLTQCANLSSDTGSPVQRVAYYFSEALRERIDREKGRFISKGVKGRERDASDADVKETVLSPNPAILDCYKLLPFSQMALFAAVQAIVEGLGSAKKVHLIDLGLKTGIPCTLLMQALAARKEYPLQLLKITAVGTTNQQGIEDAGRMLTSFAENMGFRFSFNIVMVSNLEDIKQESFELEDDESIVVYSAFMLRTMLTCSDRLDSLMRVIGNLRPCIMLVIEVEGNHNSQFFFNRFIESLFYFSAFFDCLDTCMDRNSQNRMKTEALYFGQGILNIVATEGEERTIRNVGINVWRPFFARFRMIERKFSYSALYQADLIKKQFPYGSSCTLGMNKKSLIIGWKGTSLESVSAWKFL